MPLTRDIMRKYKSSNTHLIETGTYEGDTPLLALQEGFEKVYSIEINEIRYQAAVQRFEREPRITVLRGDSAIELPNIIKGLSCPVFFWLDAHLDGPVNAPLLEELDAISKHPIKTHTILIDDVRRFGEYLLNVSKEILSEKIQKINPMYVISYENDGLTPDDVMVAHL
jgi:hypothetical protein